MKKIYFISRQVSDYLRCDAQKHALNIIDIGVLVFQRNISKFGSSAECIFRIAQDGILNLVPYMSKRIIKTRNAAVAKKLIMYRYNGVEALDDEEVQSQIEDLSPGCFVLSWQLPNGQIEALSMHKFNLALSTMIPKENLISLHLRHLNREERELSRSTLE